jgi:predicted peptidase
MQQSVYKVALIIKTRLQSFYSNQFCFMRILFFLLSILFVDEAVCQDLNLYERKTFFNGNFELRYRILVPQQFDKNTAYPLLIFLHGAGSKGYDNEAQLAIGGNYFLRKSIRDSFPAIIIFPQCPPEDLWAEFETENDSVTYAVKRVIFPFHRQPTTVSKALMALIDSLSQQQFVNKKRVYIGGLSQGAMGVLDLIARYPDVFAGGLSICGGGDINSSKRFAGKVALWLFHGSKDDVVPVSFSRGYYRRLKKENADVRYSEYEDVFHNSWVNAFKEPDLLSWLFSKSK